MSEDVTIRAARAEQLLVDEVFNEALTAVLGDALLRAQSADLASKEECIASIAAIQAAGVFQDKLRSFVTSGKAAERKPFKVA
jgi:hypothetical protein